MIGRSISVVSFIAAATAGLNFLRTQGLITTEALLWGIGVFGAVLLAWLVSWGCTSMYKNGYVPDLMAATETERHMWKWRIRQRAFYIAFGIMAMEGVILMLTTADTRHMIVYGVFWGIGSLFTGVFSPIMWWVVFKFGLPWLVNQDPALGVEIRRDEGGQVSSIKDHTQPDARTEFIGRPTPTQETKP